MSGFCFKSLQSRPRGDKSQKQELSIKYVGQNCVQYVNSESMEIAYTEMNWPDVAQDYVEGIYIILQQQEPENPVLSTGQDRSVRELSKDAFRVVGAQLESS